MAVTNGTIHSVAVKKSSAVSPLQECDVLFTMSGTYAQADNSALVGVPTLIQNSRRNGKTVTMVSVAVGTPATKTSNPATIMAVKGPAISTNDVTFELTDGDYSTELANGAIPGQERPFALHVAFTEA